ncbi:MAG: hypothetical protein NTU53_03540 [Planctomycetota bacterium]|nr:hypothetical protein [Planctomycetota bacterium]
MQLTRWAGLLFVGLLVVGCQKKASQPAGPVYPPAVAPTPETRDRIHRLAPDALIGQVIAVLPDQHLALVADLPVQEFKIGQILCFVGGDAVNTGTGVVVHIGPDALHVRYEEPQPGGRPPAVGDLAVRFKR